MALNKKVKGEGEVLNDSFLAGSGKAKIVFFQDDFPIKRFTGIHDNLYIRVLLIDSNQRFAFVSIDLTSLTKDRIDLYKSLIHQLTSIDEGNIWVSVTHTFSAPHIPLESQKDDEEKIISMMLFKTSAALKEAVNQALLSMKPAKIGFSYSSCPLNINRNIPTRLGWWLGRNDDEYSNHDVRTITLKQKNNDIIAILYNFDVQSSVMDDVSTKSGGLLISSDFVGKASNDIENTLGKDSVAIFLPGSAGDQAPIFKGSNWQVTKNNQLVCSSIHEEAYSLVDQLGVKLSQSVQRAVSATDKFADNCEIKINHYSVYLPEQRAKYSTKALRPSKNYQFEKTGNSLFVPIDILYLNNLAMIGTTPELNSSFGQKLREKFNNQNTFVCTLVNGAMKYLPEDLDFIRHTYTAMNTRLGQGSDRLFLEQIAKILEA
ncbi:conserved hypothetical protein [Oenococcus oeni]|nr:hypothetical protein [Oenococcus oeni]SYW05472.1 conserved hypothetical protein [Oenococcus oeni]